MLRALSPLPKSPLGQVVSDNSCVSSAREKMAEQDQYVNKKGKTNSAVWKFFGFKESDVEQEKVQCSRGGLAICVFWRITDGPLFFKRHNFSCADRRQRSTVSPQRGSPPPLTVHERAPSTSSITSQSSIKDALYSATAYSTSSQRHKDVTHAITFYLAKDMCPVSTVKPGV